MVRTFYEQYEEKLLKILMYVHILSLMNAYYPLDIDLLAEAAVKHYFCKTEHNFNVDEFNLSNRWSKELKHRFIDCLQDPPWIAIEWDE